MKQEDKELLLRDLCARLPYDVKVKTLLKEPYTLKGLFDTEYGGVMGCLLGKSVPNNVSPKTVNYPLSQFKPYLFPLSSMTEEQRNDISKLLIDTQNEFPPYGMLNIKGCDSLFICTVKQANALISYCLTYHLDINGLIERGLAIDATGLNIY